MPSTERPNILLVLSDEQHLSSVGCYGGEPVRTPQIDRLAAEGTRFDSAYCCCSVCSPSRAALFTGRLPHHFGEITNDLTIPAETPTLAERLRGGGYRLGYAGKWHVDRATLPSSHGFEGAEFPGYGFPCWMFRKPVDPAEMRAKPNHYYEYLVDNGYAVPTLSDPFPTYQEERRQLILHGRQSGPVEASIPYYVGDEGARLAESLCRRRQADGQPFFLWVNFWGPHNPCYLPEPHYSMYDPASIPEPPSAGDPLTSKPRVQTLMSHYWGMNGAPWSYWQEHLARYLAYATLIDEQVGRLRAALEAAGQLENTIVVYAADHGDMMGRHQMLDKGPLMYDDTYRIPLIVRGPGVERGVSDEFVYLHDLFPTILAAADVEVGPNAEAQSLTPLLGGAGQWQEREAVFGEFDSQIHRYPQRMARTRSHKFVYNAGDICELYDLENDPDELVNRITDPAYAAVKRDLQERLLAHLKAVNDREARVLEAVGWAL